MAIPIDETSVTRADTAACARNSLASGCASDTACTREDLSCFLHLAAQQLKSLDERFSSDAAKLSDLAGRLNEGRFHLAVLGQFKRGKSTLLNALLGEAVLPTAVVPLTAIPTFIQAGESLRAKVNYLDEKPPTEFGEGGAGELAAFLSRFVTEAGNPKNALGVSHVEVFHPAAILRRGVVLIDTPGIGSTFRHNTEATLNFLPQCDAALFLVSADPPVTEVEVEFLKQVRSKVARLFFILNKVDYLSEEDRRVALAFFSQVLKEQVSIEPAPVFCVSARMGLDARKADDAALWNKSGLKAVEAHLVDFLAREKAAALRVAVTRKAGDTLDDAVMRIRLGIRSLQMPLDELRDRLGSFEKKLDEIQRERVRAGDVLAGDHKRSHAFLEEYAEELRGKARVFLRGVLEETMAKSADGETDEATVQRAMAEAIPGFFEHEVGIATGVFSKNMADIFRPHQSRADELIDSVRQAAADLFDVPYHAPESSGAYQVVEQPYWVTQQWAASFSPIPQGFADRLMPAGRRRARVAKRLMDQIDDLVMRNVENLRWSTYQNLDKAFRRFQTELDARLGETMAATRGAIIAAMEKRKQRSEDVSQEIYRLASTLTEIMEICQVLGEK